MNLGLNPSSVFGEESGDSSGNEGKEPFAGREAVNHSIAKEQASLRARAVAAAGESLDATVYDYDGAYDSFHVDAKKSKIAPGNTSKDSRYIGDLLKVAKQRKHERDVAYERKVARDQATEEEADSELRGKEKFITASYKRKLEERKIWQEKDNQQRELEEASDITKQTDGRGMASFYGNLNKNTAMGGERSNLNFPSDQQAKDHKSILQSKREALHMSKNVESVVRQPGAATKEKATDSSRFDGAEIEAIEESAAERRRRSRLLREKKVSEARERYFQRQAVSKGNE